MDWLATEWVAIQRLLLAIVLGAAVGLERELKSRAAGLRTMILVCTGSALAMLVSHELADGVAGVRGADPTRIAAGVVTGVGFLGAGAILKLGDLVHGVTTAASIWFVAALGLAVGDGRYVLAVVATGLALLVLVVLQIPERWITTKSLRSLCIEVHSDHAEALLHETRKLLQGRDADLVEVSAEQRVADVLTVLRLNLQAARELDGFAIVREIARLPGVRRAEWEPVARK